MNGTTNNTLPYDHSKRIINNDLYNLPRSLRMFIMVMGLIFAMLGVIGNASTTFALTRYKRPHKVIEFFIPSLSCTDLIASLLVIPFDSMRFMDHSWTQSKALCVIVPYFRYGTIAVCLFSITALTVNRYFIIGHPNIYKKIFTHNGIKLIIGSIWIYAYVSTIPTIFGVWGQMDYEPHQKSCTIVKDSQGRSPKLYFLSLGFLLPIFTIIGCYTKIFCLVKKSEKKIRRQMISSVRVTSPSIITETKSQRTEYKVLRMVLIIFIGFLICRFPITLTKIFDPHFTNPVCQCVACLMAFSHVWINPVIYVAMNNRYRQIYCDAFSCSWNSDT